MISVEPSVSTAGNLRTIEFRLAKTLSTKGKNDSYDSRQTFWNGSNSKGNRRHQLTKWIFSLDEDTNYKGNCCNHQNSVCQNFRKVIQILFEWGISLISILAIPAICPTSYTYQYLQPHQSHDHK